VLKVGDVILGSTVVLFLTAMRILGVEPALYSILTVRVGGAHARFHPARHRGVHRRHDHVGGAAADPDAILEEMGRGITIYKARGGMTGDDREILYCVVTRLEIGACCASSRPSTRRPSSCSIRWPTCAAASSPARHSVGGWVLEVEVGAGVLGAEVGLEEAWSFWIEPPGEWANPS
jgi:hypothetical protein